MSEFTNKTLTLALTTGDEATTITNDNLLMYDVNIHVYGADVYYGDGYHTQIVAQSSATPTCAIIRANAVVWFQNLLLKELFFKSYVNATPGYVVITGVIKE
jgi:hypothetical protein